MEINKCISQDEFGQLLQQHPATLIYFFQDTCGVCAMLYPKVETMVKDHFPLLEIIRIEAEKNRELAGQLRMLAIPGIMLMLDGKEYMRSNGLMALGELKNKIERYYGMMFG
ncbi:MAG: thioredoxin family protein [Mongoliitalea sp.]